MTKIKIAFYVRVSTADKQDYQSQIDTLYDKLDSNEGKDDEFEVDIYAEKVSGYQDEREQLNAMLGRIRENNEYYQSVYIVEISRLGRNPRKIHSVLWELEDSGVSLYIAKGNMWLKNDGRRFDSMGKLALDIMISLADEEAITFKERSRRGILSSIKAGKVNGGSFLAYGFKKGANKMMEIDREEAKTVQLIFALYKGGKGARKIAGYLNSKEIPTRAKLNFGNKQMNQYTGKTGNEVEWSDKSVLDILSNPIYIGKRRYWGGKDKKNEKPTLIDLPLKETIIEKELWNDCLEIRETKTHRNYTTEYVYLLKDKIKCGCCGRNYFAKYKPTKGGDKVYICSSRLKTKGNCGNAGVNISLIESAIFNEIVDSESILRHINDKDKLRIQFEKEVKDLTTTIEISTNLVDKLDSEIDSILDLIIKANSDGKEERVKKLEDKLSKLESEKENAKSRREREQRQLSKLKIALEMQSDINTTSIELKNQTKDRIKLRQVFLQVIDKVIINSIDNNTILATVYILIDGVVLLETLKLFLDIGGMRKRVKRYSYIPMVDMSNELEYEDDVLVTEIGELKETLSVIEDNAGLIEIESISIPNNNILTIE